MGEQISDECYETFLTDATLVEPVAVITEIPDRASDLYEPNIRLITHLNWHFLKFPSCKEAFVESNDSDVVVLLPFYLKDFKDLSLAREAVGP